MKTELKENAIVAILISILFAILVSLALWGIFYIDDVDSRIYIIGIAAAIMAAFTSLMIAIMNNEKTKHREYELHVLKERQKVCEHFYNAFVEAMKNTKNRKDKAIHEMFLFKKGLMNLGSEELIKKFMEYEENSQKNKGNTKGMITSVNTFLKELRKELGFKDSNDLKLMDLILTPEARKELRE